MSIELEILNLDEFLSFFQRKAPDAVTDGVSSAMEDVGQGIRDVTTAIVPVDTGALRDSISVTISADTIMAVAGEDYASYVDQGTSKMSAQSFFEQPISLIVQTLNEVIEKALEQKGLYE